MERWLAKLVLIFFCFSLIGCGLGIPRELATGDGLPPGEPNASSAPMTQTELQSPAQQDSPSLPPQISTKMALTPGA